MAAGKLGTSSTRCESHVPSCCLSAVDVSKQNEQNVEISNGDGDHDSLAVITLVNAAENGLKCLQTSYDEVLGPYSDLSKLDRKVGVQFAECGNDPHKLQQFRLRRLTGEAGFILHPV